MVFRLQPMCMGRVFLLGCMLCMCTFVRLKAQDKGDILSCYGLRDGKQLPKDILTTRSACVLFLPNAQHMHWRTWAEKAHAYFRKIGVDVVIYVLGADIFIGEEALSTYTAQLRSRRVRNVLFLHLDKGVGVQLRIVPLAETEGLVAYGAAAWQHRAPTLSLLSAHLTQTITKQALPHSNWLISEQVESLPFVALANKSVKRLPARLYTQYLGVMLRCLPCEQESTCAFIAADNQQLKSWFATHYRASYIFISPSMPLPTGYEHTLHILYGFRATIDAFLQAPSRAYSPEEEQEQVYACYVRHALTGVVYAPLHRRTSISELLAPLQEAKH